MIPVDELIEYLKAEEVEAEAIAKLERAAVAYISEQTGVYYGTEAERVEQIVYRGGVIALADTPTGDVVLEQWGGSDWTEIDSTAFVRNGRLIYGYAPAGPYPIHLRATYDAGFVGSSDDFDAPEDIKQGVRMLVEDWFRRRDGRDDNGSSMEVAGAVAAIIRNHKRAVV